MWLTSSYGDEVSLRGEVGFLRSARSRRSMEVMEVGSRER